MCTVHSEHKHSHPEGWDRNMLLFLSWSRCVPFENVLFEEDTSCLRFSCPKVALKVKNF